MASEKEKEFQAATPEYTATAEVSVPLLPQGNFSAEAQVGYPPSYQPSANDQSGQPVPPYPYPSGGVYQPTVGTSKQPYPPGPYPQPGAGPYPHPQPGAGPYAQPGSVAYAQYGPGGPGQQPMVIVGQPGQFPPGTTVMMMNGPMDPKLHKIKDLLPLSIINLVCCCLVFGIVATVYSVRIREAKRRNDYQGAKKMYKVMLGMNIAGIVIGFVSTAIITVLRLTASSY